MDISKLVEYDRTVAVDIVTPAGDPVGITFNMVSFQSERVTAAARKVEAERYEAMFAATDQKLSRDQIIEFANRQDDEQIIAAIVSWDFGENTFGDLASDAECNDVNKRYLIKHPNSKWIKDQLVARGGALLNFINPLPENAATTSD